MNDSSKRIYLGESSSMSSEMVLAWSAESVEHSREPLLQHISSQIALAHSLGHHLARQDIGRSFLG